jgi:DNA-binding NarL/FixJ family response regulator
MRKKRQIFERNGTIDLDAVIIGEPSLTQNMIRRFLTDRDFEIIKTVSLEDGLKTLEECDALRIVVIEIDKANDALVLIQSIEEIYNKRGIPKPGVMVWSEYDNFTHVETALINGANSFIGGKETDKDLIRAIWRTADKVNNLPPRLAGKMKKTKLLVKELSDRERSIFSMIQLGLSNDEIATKLGIKKHSVENNLKTICEKMGVTNREELYWL